MEALCAPPRLLTVPDSMPMLVQCFVAASLLLVHVRAIHQKEGQHNSHEAASLRGSKQQQYPGESPYTFMQPMAYDCTPCTAQLPGGAGFAVVQSAEYDCSPCFAMAQQQSAAFGQPMAAAYAQPMSNVVPMVQQVTAAVPVVQPMMMQPVAMAQPMQPMQLMPVAVVSGIAAQAVTGLNDSSSQADLALPANASEQLTSPMLPSDAPAPAPYATIDRGSGGGTSLFPATANDDQENTTAMGSSFDDQLNQTTEIKPIVEVSSDEWNESSFEDANIINVSVINVEAGQQLDEDAVPGEDAGTWSSDTRNDSSLGVTAKVPLKPEVWPPPGADDAEQTFPFTSAVNLSSSALREQVRAMEEAAQQLAVPRSDPAQLTANVESTGTYSREALATADHCTFCSAQFLAQSGCQALFSQREIDTLIAPGCEFCSQRLWDMCTNAAAQLQQKALTDAAAFVGAAPPSFFRTITG